MSEPTLAEQEFERWHELRKDPLKRELADASFVDAWAKVAWLAEGRMIAMGRELAKAQARIGRQRKANRELVERVRQMEEALPHFEQALRQWRMYADTERQFNEDWIVGADDPEALLYRDAMKALDAFGDSTRLEQGER